MKKRSGSPALAGVLTALAVVCLLLTTTPVATVGLAALAAVCGIPVVIELGRPAGLLHFAATALLALLLIPSVEGKGMYVAFFGWYTVFKSYLEGKNWPRPAEWIIKISCCLAATAAYGGVWVWLLKMPIPHWFAGWMLPLMAVGVGVLFVVYDRGLTGLIATYFTHIRPKIRGVFRF